MQKRLNQLTCHFGWRLRWAEGTVYYMGVQIPQEEWAIFGRFKSIGNLHCSSRCHVHCKRDYSIARNVMQQKDHSVCQASANSILKISRRRRCGLSTSKGDRIAQCGWSLISTIAVLQLANVTFIFSACNSWNGWSEWTRCTRWMVDLLLEVV